MHDQPPTGQMFQPARVPAWRHRSRRARRFARTEPLEGRTLWAVQAPVDLAISPNVNITRLLENQNEAAIAIDRSNPGNLFMGSVNDARTGPLDDVDANLDGIADPPPLLKADSVRGLVGAYSNDGGVTWTSGTLDGDLTNDGVLPAACCDPSVAYDDFGNLFITFINRDLDQVLVAMSTDAGRTFTQIGSFTSVDPLLGAIDQPTVVTGPGSVWITFQRDSEIVASGARVLGLGVLDPDQTFESVQSAPRSLTGNFGDIAIGPNGEVMVTYQISTLDPDIVIGDDDVITIDPVTGEPVVSNLAGPADIFVNVDPDGFGPEGFGNRVKVTRTTMGSFDPVPAQNDRTIDAEAGLAWDRSGGPFNGRVWLVYTDEGLDESDSNTDIRLRFSDDDGRTWSSFRTVTDEDFTRASQFLPRIALDQTTGNIAITWHDTRIQNDNSFGPNDEVGFWGTVGVPTVSEGGVAFAGNIQISQGLSDAARSRAVIELGDYTGLDFHNNVFYPVWGDNSNITGDNPSGGVNVSPTALATFDVYTSRITVTARNPVPPEQAPVGPGSPLTPQFNGRDTITKGKVYKFQVRYQSPNGIDVSSLDDSDLLVTGPQGYNLFADFQRAKRSRGGTVVTGTYLAPAPGGKFDQGDNGLYSILLQAGEVRDLSNTLSAAGLLDQFLVSSTQPPQAPPVLAAPPVSAALQPAAADGDSDDDKLKAVGL
jgi:hypothetical protein